MISVCFIKLIKKGCGLCRYVQSLLDAKLLLTSTETLEPSSTISLNLKYTNKRTKFKIAGTVQKETPQVNINGLFLSILSFFKSQSWPHFIQFYSSVIFLSHILFITFKNEKYDWSASLSPLMILFPPKNHKFPPKNHFFPVQWIKPNKFCAPHKHTFFKKLYYIEIIWNIISNTLILFIVFIIFI